MRAMTLSLLVWDRIVNTFEAGKSFSIRQNKEFASSSSQKTISGGQTAGKLLKNSPPVYFLFAFNVEKKFSA